MIKYGVVISIAGCLLIAYFRRLLLIIFRVLGMPLIIGKMIIRLIYYLDLHTLIAILTKIRLDASDISFFHVRRKVEPKRARYVNLLPGARNRCIRLNVVS